VPIFLKSGSLNLLESSGPVQACNRIALTLRLLRQQRLNKEIEGQVDNMKEEGCTKYIVITKLRENLVIVNERILNFIFLGI